MFHQPEFLVLLLLPAITGAVSVWRGGCIVPLPGDHLELGRHPFMNVLLRASSLVPHLFLALAIVFLSGPEREVGLQTRPRITTNVVVAMDVSGSMSYMLDGSTRYAVAIKALEEFAPQEKQRSGDSFGLIYFGTLALQWLPLTTDWQAFLQSLNLWDPAKTPQRMAGTNLRQALLTGQRALRAEQGGDRMLLLVTDGEDSTFTPHLAEQLGQQFRNDGIRLYILQIGYAAPTPAMSTVAGRSGGMAFVARNGAAIAQVFSDISKMRRSEIEVYTPGREPAYRPWVLVGLYLGVFYIITLAGGLRFAPW